MRREGEGPEIEKKKTCPPPHRLPPHHWAQTTESHQPWLNDISKHQAQVISSVGCVCKGIVDNNRDIPHYFGEDNPKKLIIYEPGVEYCAQI